MTGDRAPPGDERATDTEAGQPIQASEDAAKLVERMCDRLGLWRSRTEAALFLAALAAAEDADPVERNELGPLTSIGTIETDQEALPILGLLDEASASPDAVREEQLPGWIQAGAESLGPRLAGADVAEATAEVVAVFEELSDASA